MTITRRGEKRFAGIVAVGENRTAACNNFRAAVLEQDMILLSESSSVFVAVAGVNPDKSYSPISGRDAVLAEDSLVDSLESTSSDIEHTDIFLSVCTDGCGHVIVSDAHYQPDYCPSCSSAIPELDEHETINALSELESDSFDNNLNGDEMSVKGNQGIVVVADSLQEAQALFVEASSDEGERVHLQDGEAQFITHSSSDSEFSPFNGEASEISDEEFELTSVSNADGEFDAHYLQCLASGCGSHVITSSEDASYCPRCSSGLVDPEVLSTLSSDSSVDDTDDDDDEDLDLDLGIDTDDDDFESDSNDFDHSDLDDDFESESGDDEDLDDLDEDDLEDLDSDLDDDDFESDSSDFEDEDEDDFESDSGDDEDDLEDDLDDMDDDEDLEDLDDLEDDDEDDDDDFESESSEVELNFFEAYAGLNEDEHDTSLLSVAYCGKVAGESTWVAFYGGYPVARCLHSNSSAPELFENTKFGEATQVSVSSQGISKGLEDMGFEMFKPDIDLGVSVSQKLSINHANELDAVRAETENTIAEVTDRFEAALATAGMALNRNVVRGKTNPIAETLIASLSAAGVNNASELVNSAFEQRSDAFIKNMVTLASEQVAKPLESQNDFTNMVSQASFLSSSAVRSDAGIEIGRTLATDPKQNLISEAADDNAEGSFKSKSSSLISSL